MGDLNEWNAGFVECAGNIDHLINGNLVLFGVHAVAKTHVMQGDLTSFKLHSACPYAVRR